LEISIGAVSIVDAKRSCREKVEDLVAARRELRANRAVAIVGIV
jgi:hypothetical protein